jgi:hypothetical protein
MSETVSKPTLDEKSFQRLLAAAFIIQSRGDWISKQNISAADTKPLAIVQERTPSRLPSLARRDALSEVSTISKISGLMFWKRVEALAIALVFTLMMGVSIHDVLALPGHISSPYATLEPLDAAPLGKSKPTDVTSSREAAAAEKPRQWLSALEGKAFDDDVVIHYQASAINLSGHAEKGTDSKISQSQSLFRKYRTPEANVRVAAAQVREIVAGPVVQYGDDVTMWLSVPSKKYALTKLADPSH